MIYVNSLCQQLLGLLRFYHDIGEFNHQLLCLVRSRVPFYYCGYESVFSQSLHPTHRHYDSMANALKLERGVDGN